MLFQDTLKQMFYSSTRTQCECIYTNQDNTSVTNLEINGKESSGKSTRCFDIKFFYFTNISKSEKINVEYCPADEIMADYMIKLLVRFKFVKSKNKIMGTEEIS